MDFQQSFFEIFQLPERFGLDAADLDERYRELQRSVHPDRHAGASDQDKRMSVQWATHINEAYRTLKTPLDRAIYLLKLRGVNIEHNPSLDPGFLMTQIELREELEELADTGDALARLDAFKVRIRSLLEELQARFAGQFEAQPEAATQTVYQMQFIDKLRREADQLEEKLLDY